MRVGLHVHQHAKVESEVATTTRSYSSSGQVSRCQVSLRLTLSNHSTLGYEWILMQFMKGEVLETTWKAMTRQNKVGLVRTVAQSLAQLFKHGFKGIGNIYFQKCNTSSSGADATTRGDQILTYILRVMSLVKWCHWRSFGTTVEDRR